MISIIVPVYNTEKYLDQCIQSILAQTYNDFELLLIDDGSTDSSGAICDKYAEQDSRVRVFHKDNGGVSSARNMGLDNAKGEWITFVDADDELYIDALKVLAEISSNTFVDLVIAGYDFYDDIEKKMIRTTSQPCQKSLFYARDVALTRIYQNKIGFWPWFMCSKLFKARIIKTHAICFNEHIAFSEDRLFVIEYICAINNGVHFLSTPIYKYRKHENSVMSKSDKIYDKRSISGVVASALMYKSVCNSTMSIYNRFLAKCDFINSYKTQKRIMSHYKVSGDLYKDLDDIVFAEISRLEYWLTVVFAKICSKFI